MQFGAKIRNLSALILILALFAAVPAFCQWDKDVFSFRGRKALSEGQYSLAIENFNILARLDTSDYWTFFFRGIAKYNLGDLRGAQNDFNTSVRLNPVFTNGYHYRAITQSRFGNYDAALEDYKTAISLRPGTEGLYYSRGVTYFLSRQFEKALSDFNRYIRKQPKDPAAYLNRGACNLYLKDTVAALEDYNTAIRLDRFDSEGYVRRASLFAASGKMSLALTDLDKAIELEADNTLAHFNRALIRYEKRDYRGAMEDLDYVLNVEPGNALTLYNRGLIKAQLGDYQGALEDLDRVVNINPGNVLVHFNRASVFIQMGRYRDALEDYDKAIELYPDFAKAYMNRSYVKNMLGMTRSSKSDYDTARRKIKEYRARNLNGATSFADTTKKFDALLSLDGEFSKKDFNDEMLQYRDVDVKLRPLYRFVRSEGPTTAQALSKRYENPAVERFIASAGAPLVVVNDPPSKAVSSASEGTGELDGKRAAFLAALDDCSAKRYNSAMANLTQAVDLASEKPSPKGSLSHADESFYLMNRAVLRSDMIDFMASMDNNVQVLSMDDSGNTRARVKDKVSKTYDYSEALDDMKRADRLTPGVAYILFNLGNLYCLSADHISSIASYTKAIKAYPYMADAYFNRGLVQIFLKDKEKGCNDLSVAGELGVKDAYTIIKKYCENEVH